MSKTIVFDEELRLALKAGVEKMGKTVASTLGPKGRTVILDRSFGAPKVSKNGITVAEEVKLVDKNENMAAQMLKAAADKTNTDAGDGTTTAIVLAEAMFLQGLKHVISGANPIALFRGMQQASSKVLAHLDSIALPLDGTGVIEKVAAIACDGDQETGKMIADTLKAIGPDGVFTVEDGKSLNNEINHVQGMCVDRGYISSHFVNDQDSGQCVLDNPMILFFEDKISNFHKLVPLLEMVAQEGRPLLIVAEDVEGDALSTLVMNHLSGVIKAACIKAPGYGQRRKSIMGDLAVLTGGEFFTKDLGTDLEAVQPIQLGAAKQVIIDKDSSTFVEGAGTPAEIDARIATIRTELENTDSDYDTEKLQERLARFAGGVAKFMVGAASETELREKKARVKSALNATRNAIESGVLPGGGVALARAAVALGTSDSSNQDETMGYDIVREVLQKPLRTIADNAGVPGSVVAFNVLKSDDNNYGYDVLTQKYGDMNSMGILDPLKVVSSALTNAISCAGILLTAEVSIALVPEEAAAMPDMGGMGGMPGMM